MGSAGRGCPSGRRQRGGGLTTGRKRLGVDCHQVWPVRGFSAHAVLSGVLARLLRRRTLRTERWVARDGCLYVAPFIPQLVPAQLSLCLRKLSPGRRLSPGTTLGTQVGTHE